MITEYKCVLRKLFVWCVGIFMLALPLHSQNSTGSIVGAVTDSKSALLAGATVTVTNNATGEKRATKTSSSNWTPRPRIFWSRKGTIRSTARGRCAGRWSVSSKTRWPRKSSRAACTKVKRFSSQWERTGWFSTRKPPRRARWRVDHGFSSHDCVHPDRSFCLRTSTFHHAQKSLGFDQ